MTNQSVWKTRFLIRRSTPRISQSAISHLHLRYLHGMARIKSVVLKTLTGSNPKEDRLPCNSNRLETSRWKKCWKVCPSPPNNTNSTYNNSQDNNKCTVISIRFRVVPFISNTRRWCFQITTRYRIINVGSQPTLANQIRCNNYQQTPGIIHLIIQMLNIRAFLKSIVFLQPSR